MSSIDQQREDFERFCSERFGENGCQTSKTIAREKGQKIIHRLQNDPIADTCGSCFKFLVKQPGFSQESRDCAILSLRNLEIAQQYCTISRLARNFGIPRMRCAISRLRGTYLVKHRVKGSDEVAEQWLANRGN